VQGAWAVKRLLKPYLGLALTNNYSTNEMVFHCPSDVGFPLVEAVDEPSFTDTWVDCSSYIFNGVNVFNCPNICDLKLSAIRLQVKTILMQEYSANGPVTWHDGITKFQPRTNKARSNVFFVDGHTRYTRMYYEANSAGSYAYNPPDSAGFDYVWYEP
jgi:prepilin-type processing-associated H-X9-DG protein